MLPPICAPFPKALATFFFAASSAAFRSRSAFSSARRFASAAFSASVFSGFFTGSLGFTTSLGFTVSFLGSVFGFSTTVSSSVCVSRSCSEGSSGCVSAGAGASGSSGSISTSTSEGSSKPRADSTFPSITGTPPASSSGWGTVKLTRIKRAITATCTNSAPSAPTNSPFFLLSSIIVSFFSS